MKKFFSFLCALAIVLSASAVPQITAKKALQGKHSFEMAQQMKAERGHVAIKKAPARKEATQITIVDCTAEYYSEDGDFVYTLIDADGIEYYFAFPSTGADIESGKTYTLADMDSYYCYWMNWDTWDYTDFTAVTFVKTVEANGSYKIVVNATDENGAQFVLTYEFKITGETVTIELSQSVNKPEYYSEDGDWYFGGHNLQYEFAMDIYGEETSLVGEYTFADFYTYYTYVYDLANEKEIAAKDAKATITAGTNDTLLINAEILGSDGVKYIIKAFYVAPSALAQKTITSEELEIYQDVYESYWYAFDRYSFYAADDANEIYFSWIDAEEAGSCLGTFKTEDFSVFAVTPMGDDYSNAFSGSVTIASASDKLTITGSILCYNNVQYTLNLSGVNTLGVEDVVLNEKAQKVMIDGAMYIVRDNKLFNVQGVQVR